jgi:hypothetical protein
MPTNTLRAHVHLSYQGKTQDLTTTIDLDACLDQSEEAPDFHHLLAHSAGIDTYSYLYEVLGSYDIEFSEATGIAAQCCEAGRFDWWRFVQLQREESELRALRTIAAETLGVEELDQHPALKAALWASYRAGKGERSGA